jgi:oligopeptide/dipeptide ABC transporter ATP-binding protein
MSELLRLENLAIHFPIRGGLLDRMLGRTSGVVRALDGIDLTVAPAEIVAIVGESGSGKTTMARAIVKLLAPTKGVMRFEGADVTRTRGIAALRSFRRRVQMIFQDPYQALNPRHTIFNAVAEPLRGLRLTRGAADTRDRVAWALEAAGLRPAASFFRRFPGELSGGQRQRAVIAGALAVRPALIVADEPVSMLDVSIRAQILQVLMRLREKEGVAILFITHDLPVAWLIADRIAVMYLGKIVEIGQAAEVTFRPRHPYTAALLNAAPQVDPMHAQRRSAPLRGEIPTAARIPKGCRFHPRCPLAFDRCRSEEPPTIEVLPGHLSACWLASSMVQPTKNG